MTGQSFPTSLLACTKEFHNAPHRKTQLPFALSVTIQPPVFSDQSIYPGVVVSQIIFWTDISDWDPKYILLNDLVNKVNKKFNLLKVYNLIMFVIFCDEIFSLESIYLFCLFSTFIGTPYILNLFVNFFNFSLFKSQW